MEGSARVRVLKVIEVEVLRGRGDKDLGCEAPTRNVLQYFSEEGEFLAENDPMLPVKYINGRGVYQYCEWKSLIEPPREGE